MAELDFEYEEKWLIHAVCNAAHLLPNYEIWLDRCFISQVIHISAVDRAQTEFTVTYLVTYSGEIKTTVLSEYQQVAVIKWIHKDKD